MGRLRIVAGRRKGQDLPDGALPLPNARYAFATTPPPIERYGWIRRLLFRFVGRR